MKTLVLVGIGQTMRGDDAIGVLAVEAWGKQYPDTANHPQIRVETAELPGLDLLELLSGADCAVIVDAVESDSPPGTIQVYDEGAVLINAPGSGSAHGWGVAETLRLGRELKREDMPPEIVVIGITAAQLELGVPLSPALNKRLPEVVKWIEQQVRGWLGD
jgi:hydrogenase maturation protease